MKNKKLIIFSLILLILLIVGLFFFSPLILIKILGKGRMNLIENTIPLNNGYKTAITVIIGYLSYLSYKFLFTFNAKKRKIGILLFVLGSVLFFFGIGYFTKDYNFDKNGNFTKCWASDLKGSYVSVPCDWSKHPEYGTPVQSYTREIALNIRKLKDTKINRIFPNSNTKFFSQDNRPLVWYYSRSDGKYELFGNSGTHPQNGELLKPIIPEVSKIIISFMEKEKTEDIIFKKSIKKKTINSNDNLELLNTNKGISDYKNNSTEKSYDINKSPKSKSIVSNNNQIQIDNSNKKKKTGQTSTFKSDTENNNISIKKKVLNKLKKCEQNNTGNYTIINNTKKTLRLNVVQAKKNDNLNRSNRYSARTILRPNQKKHFYDAPVKKHFYYAFDKDVNSSYSYDEGYFKVSECQTNVITISSNYSNENTNNNLPKKVDKKCISNNTGDICVINGTNKTFRLNVVVANKYDNLNHSGLSSSKITLRPNQKKYFYDVPAKKHFYYVFDSSIRSAYANSYDEGYIKVVKCKMNNHTIR